MGIMTNDYGCRGGFQKFGWPAIGHSSALFGLCGLSIHFHYASLEWCDGSTVGTLADPGEGGDPGLCPPQNAQSGMFAALHQAERPEASVIYLSLKVSII